MAPHEKFSHCIIRRETIAAMNLEPEVHRISSVVSFIKTRHLNTRIFTVLCNEMGSDHKNLLCHWEVHWLSCGKVLKSCQTQIFELSILLWQKDKSSKSADLFCDAEWLSVVCLLPSRYLSKTKTKPKPHLMCLFKVKVTF